MVSSDVCWSMFNSQLLGEGSVCGDYTRIGTRIICTYVYIINFTNRKRSIQFTKNM